jgi:eukaryotic-like serine/threonine-protein kinase
MSKGDTNPTVPASPATPASVPVPTPPASGTVPANLDSEVGKYVLDSGLVTKEELNYVRDQHNNASDPNQRSLADLLVEHQFITINQAKRIRQAMDVRRTGLHIPGYDMKGLLGKGAMAKVFLARQTSLDRVVAIKILPSKRSLDADFVERFYKEGRAAAKLSHPNIVQAYDVGSTQEGTHYFVMEYVEGKTLYDLMAPPPQGEGKMFSEAEALDVAIQMGEALAHAHKKGLIHRDVKPKNILLMPSGIAKLLDLGLARAIDDKQAAESEAGKAYGTPYYISPEQIRGEVDIDYRTDLYSLGATLYHLVTGRVPFDGDTPSAVMHRHLNDEMIPPDHLNRSLSAGVSEIIEFAMAKDKNQRYNSTEDMLEDLRLVRAGDSPIHARHEVDMDALQKMEQHGQTVDIEPKAVPSLWDSPTFIAIVIAAGILLVANLILVLMLVAK